MTILQILFNIRNVPDKGKSTRTRSYSDRQIKFWIRTVRNFLITKDIEKKNSTPVVFEQDLGCWPLETVDQADCPEYLWGTDVRVARIPRILDITQSDGRAPQNRGLTFFGLIDKRTRIYVPDQQYGSLDEYTRYKPKKQMTGMMVGGQTIYVKGNGVEKLCTVNVRGVFEDPTLVSYYTEQGEQICYDEKTTQYPIPTDLEQAMYDMIFEKYIIPFAQVKPDDINEEAATALV